MSERFPRAAVTAAGVWRIPHLASFLPEVDRLVFERWPRRGTDALLGWSGKPSAAAARKLAAARGIAYLALEDGFMRSVSLGQAGAPPLSLVADRTGFYFDASRPSDLENMLQAGVVTGGAQDAIAFKNSRRLSKYNFAPPLDLGVKTKKRVLVMDQTAGDASIAGALADAGSFARMVTAARAENPGAEIIVKIHPATAEGYRAGCIAPDTIRDLRVIAQACDPIALLEQVDAVYAVSSLAGFEGLLLGLPVRCFGMPFYAGWGATSDEFSCARRTARRSVEEIFAAAYMAYARYIDPLSGKVCDIFAAMERLALFKARALQGPFACHGFAPWKHAPVRDLLGAAGAKVSFHASMGAARRRARAEKGRMVLWAARETDAMALGSAPLLRMEDGFLRSVGLGSDFTSANSYVLDDLGIYYDATRPSRLETLLENEIFDPGLTARAAKLRAAIVAARLSKYNLGGAAGDVFAGAGAAKKILVTGQVEDDASIAKGCEDIADNMALLRAVRAARPDGFIVYKEHPDVTAGNRKGRIVSAGLADAFVTDADIIGLIEASEEIHTMTSLAGFEALLRGKSVQTYGRPFYAGWGLTADRLDFPRRTRRLTLDELVAGCLILYPLYLDPATRLPCEPEFLLAALAQAQRAPNRRSSAARYLRAVTQSLFARPRARI